MYLRVFARIEGFKCMHVLAAYQEPCVHLHLVACIDDCACICMPIHTLKALSVPACVAKY